MHSCVRPYKTINNQTRPFETLQGNILAYTILNQTRPQKIIHTIKDNIRLYFKTIQHFKRPLRTNQFNSVWNHTRPNETILEQTRLAKLHKTVTKFYPQKINLFERKDTEDCWRLIAEKDGKLYEVFMAKLGLVSLKEGHCNRGMTIQDI